MAITRQQEHKPLTIIWDWNGTLLNDIDICIRSMNRMLEARNLPLLQPERYREVFTFPVKDYYCSIGFDFSKEPWDIAAVEFIDLYLAALPECGLTEGAADQLRVFKARGYRQAIISAMHHDSLVQSVDSLGILPYFDYIGGIGDHYGAGKIENAKAFLERESLDPARIILVGDTLHDAEVASELQCNCILYARGHQSVRRLEKAGIPVVEHLAQLPQRIDEMIAGA